MDDLDSACPSEHLARLQDSWTTRGVDLSAYFLPSSNAIVLCKLFVKPKDRKSGLGSEAVRGLVELADSFGAEVRLSPSTDFGATSVTRLVTFYKRFGFVANAGHNRDFSVSETMYRKPKAVVAREQDSSLNDDQAQLNADRQRMKSR